MAGGIKQCPECGQGLESDYRKTSMVWVCPARHGIALDISEAGGFLQRDELDAIWRNAASSPISKRPSPISGRPMLQVTFPVDEDSAYDNVSSDGRTMTIELDPDNFFAWFDGNELAEMPEAAAPRSQAVGLGALGTAASKFDDLFK